MLELHASKKVPVQFLGEGVRATSPPYPTGEAEGYGSCIEILKGRCRLARR
jgi:hypothetical protein